MCVRIAHLAGLRFSATQIFSQFGGQFLFARHIVALIFTHGKCFAAIRLQAQALRRSRRAIGLTLRPCMTIGAPAFYKAVCIAPKWALPERRGSSVVERTLGKGEAESSILSRGTISLIDRLWIGKRAYGPTSHHPHIALAPGGKPLLNRLFQAAACPGSL